jgi:hypothetical protein
VSIGFFWCWGPEAFFYQLSPSQWTKSMMSPGRKRKLKLGWAVPHAVGPWGPYLGSFNREIWARCVLIENFKLFFVERYLSFSSFILEFSGRTLLLTHVYNILGVRRQIGRRIWTHV